MYHRWQANGGDLQEVIFLSLDFRQRLPAVLLVPNFGILGKAFDHVASSDFKLTRINLEGDFSSKVRVYGEEGQQINILEYITTDVMDTILSNVKDIVLYNDKYMSISVNTELDGAAIKRLIEGAQIITKELKQKTHIL